MTTREKLVRNTLSLPELAEYLKNVSEAACKINDVSRQHFYDIKKACKEAGLGGASGEKQKEACIK